MKKIQFYLTFIIFGMLISMSSMLIKIEKEMQDLKELKMTMQTVESQIKLLTPPPEFFQLPVVRRP